MAVTLRSIVFDCLNPSVLANFYADLLHGRADSSDPEWAVVLFEHPPRLAFQRIENYLAPVWPDGNPQQVHLDMTVVDLDASTQRALDLGAHVLNSEVDDDGSKFTVLADPAGHPF